MAEETSSLHIDTDWKKQAQEEKRKLAEAEKAKAEQAKAPAAPPTFPPGVSAPAGVEPAARGRPAGHYAGRCGPAASCHRPVLPPSCNPSSRRFYFTWAISRRAGASRC